MESGLEQRKGGQVRKIQTVELLLIWIPVIELPFYLLCDLQRVISPHCYLIHEKSLASSP